MSQTSASLVKYTANYRTVDDLNNLRIRVRWRFSDCAPQWNSLGLAWQQKVYSAYERDCYGNAENCVTDLEKKYHDQVAKLADVATETVVYTLVNEDSVARLQEIRGCRDDEACDVMCVMADLGEERDKLWIKNEKLLVSLNYNRSRRLLTVYPDFTVDIPYKMRILGVNSSRTFLYFVEHVSEPIPAQIKTKEAELLAKLARHKMALKKPDKMSRMLPKSPLEIVLNLEILYGRHFENNGLCVRYVIELPSADWSVRSGGGDLEGVTRTCWQGRLKDGTAHFGYATELTLSYTLTGNPNAGTQQPPCIYFEVVSMDTFDRCRCEGLTYQFVPVWQSGLYEYDLDCIRLVANGVWGQLRRFFIGDATNFDDVTWIGLPKMHEGRTLNKFGVETVGTGGTLGIRLNIVHQSQIYHNNHEFSENDAIFDRINEFSTSSTLVKSVEEVVKAFRRARQNMKNATKKSL